MIKIATGAADCIERYGTVTENERICINLLSNFSFFPFSTFIIFQSSSSLDARMSFLMHSNAQKVLLSFYFSNSFRLYFFFSFSAFLLFSFSFFLSLSPLPVLPCFRYSFFFNLFLFVVSHYFHIYPFLVCPHRRRDRRRHGLLCAVRCVPRRLHRRPRWAADSEVPPNVCGSARAAFVRRQPSTANHTARRSLALRWHRGESREACKPFQRHTCAAVDHFHRPRLRRGRRACRKGVQRASPRGHSPFDKVSFFRFTYTFYLFIFVPSVLLSFPHHSFILSLVHPLSSSFFIFLHLSSFLFIPLLPLTISTHPSPSPLPVQRACVSPVWGVWGRPRGVGGRGTPSPHRITPTRVGGWGCVLSHLFLFLSFSHCSLTPLIYYLSVHSFIHLIIHLFICSFIHPFIQSFIHTLPTQSPLCVRTLSSSSSQ